MTRFFKECIPPILFRWFKIKPKYGWFGNYNTWQEAEKQCTGYDAGNILEKVKNALLKVKSGEAVAERDSVLLDKIEYSWPLLAGLSRIAAESEGRLHVLDFGGSLGSTYYQCRNFLSFVKEFSWSIVEQMHFVECGQKYFQDDTLKFFETIEDCLTRQQPNVLVLSSVMQYLEKPYEWIDRFCNHNFQYIIIDRTAFIEGDHDRLTTQKVPRFIYEATYPCWFFNKKSFMDAFLKRYDLIAETENNIDHSNLEKSFFQGFIFKKKL